MANFNESINHVSNSEQLLLDAAHNTLNFINPDKTYYREVRLLVLILDFVEQDIAVRRFTGNV